MLDLRETCVFRGRSPEKSTFISIWYVHKHSRNRIVQWVASIFGSRIWLVQSYALLDLALKWVNRLHQRVVSYDELSIIQLHCWIWKSYHPWPDSNIVSYISGCQARSLQKERVNYFIDTKKKCASNICWMISSWFIVDIVAKLAKCLHIVFSRDIGDCLHGIVHSFWLSIKSVQCILIYYLRKIQKRMFNQNIRAQNADEREHTV